MSHSEYPARDEFLNHEEVAPLVECINDQSIDVRVAVLEALTRLPLTPEDWIHVASTAARAFESINSPADRGRFLEAARWIPVRSFQQGVVDSLLGEVDDRDAARRGLAARQLALMDVSPALEQLRRRCHSLPSKDEARFWLALAIAERGDDAELKRFFLNAFTHLQDVLAGDGRTTSEWLHDVCRAGEGGQEADRARAATRFLERRERGPTDGSPLRPSWARGGTPGFTAYGDSERAEARALVERLNPPDPERPWAGPNTEGMRVILDRDPAPAVVSALFEKAYEGPHVWWTIGNAIVEWVESVQGRFQPDLEGLFANYRRQAEELFREYREESRSFAGADDEGGPRSFCYSVAWTVSRGGLPGLIPGLRAHLAAEDPAERMAAAYQIADAADYVLQPFAEQFGGGFAPDRSSAGGMIEDLPDWQPGQQVGPPRQPLHALLECESVVTAGSEFECSVGLADRPQPPVIGDAMYPPPGTPEDYLVVAHVVADGFSARTGEGWIHELPVRHDEPLPLVTLHLTPEAQDQDVTARAIQVTYSVGGHTIGFALRPLAVVRGPERPSEVVVPLLEETVALALPTAVRVPDLTVRIMRGKPEQQGRLVWTFDTPYDDVVLPREEIPTELGNNPAAFARSLVSAMSQHEGMSDLDLLLKGTGRKIADHMPERFWDLLAQVIAATKGRAPAVQLLSAEPYVPWELAVLPEPLDPDRPPFLAAQVDVGRWVLANKPPPAPPDAHEIEALAVVSGRYARGKWQRLREAEGEAAELLQRYTAVSVNADLEAVVACLAGTPKAELLHFALHGTYDPEAVHDGLFLVDGHFLEASVVMGADLIGAPFVFLNACQVGSGSQVLGDYAGLAASFLYAGACAVVAPLWSVDDRRSRQLALRFYDRVFAGDSPARALREERASLAESPSATSLAYVFFGHPNMRLELTVS